MAAAWALPFFRPPAVGSGRGHCHQSNILLTQVTFSSNAFSISRLWLHHCEFVALCFVHCLTCVTCVRFMEHRQTRFGFKFRYLLTYAV